MTMMAMQRVKVCLAALFAICLAAGFFLAWTAPAQAATPELSYKKVWLQKGTNEKLKVKNAKSVKWSVSSGKDLVTLTSKKATSVKVKAKKKGKAVVVAKVGKKTLKCTVRVFKESSFDSLHMGYYGDLFVKKNHVLYDSNGKVICRDVLYVDGDGGPGGGFWVLKVNRRLYHYSVSGNIYKSTYERSKKILSGVKELPKNIGRLNRKYTYALKSNGVVYRLARKIKNGTYINSYSLKKMMTGVSHLYIGYDGDNGNIFAVKKNGSLWGWGTNEYGEMANGKTTKVKKPRKIMAHVDNFFLVDECWGMVGYGNTCFALKDGGTLYAWGFNRGDIPEGGSEKVTSPVKVMDNIVTVRATDDVITAIDAKKQLWLWGRYSTHAEGNTVYMTTFSPTLVAKNVAYADSAILGVYYIKTNGTLYWIYLRGEGSVDEYLNSQVKVMTGVKAICTSEEYALKKNGALYRLTMNNGKISKKKVGGGY